MRSEKEKMLAGEIYVGDGPDLAADNARASVWMDRFSVRVSIPAERGA